MNPPVLGTLVQEKKEATGTASYVDDQGFRRVGVESRPVQTCRWGLVRLFQRVDVLPDPNGTRLRTSVKMRIKSNRESIGIVGSEEGE